MNPSKAWEEVARMDTDYKDNDINALATAAVNMRQIIEELQAQVAGLEKAVRDLQLKIR